MDNINNFFYLKKNIFSFCRFNKLHYGISNYLIWIVSGNFKREKYIRRLNLKKNRFSSIHLAILNILLLFEKINFIYIIIWFLYNIDYLFFCGISEKTICLSKNLVLDSQINMLTIFILIFLKISSNFEKVYIYYYILFSITIILN